MDSAFCSSPRSARDVARAHVVSKACLCCRLAARAAACWIERRALGLVASVSSTRLLLVEGAVDAIDAFGGDDVGRHTRFDLVKAGVVGLLEGLEGAHEVVEGSGSACGLGFEYGLGRAVMGVMAGPCGEVADDGRRRTQPSDARQSRPSVLRCGEGLLYVPCLLETRAEATGCGREAVGGSSRALLHLGDACARQTRKRNDGNFQRSMRARRPLAALGVTAGRDGTEADGETVERPGSQQGEQVTGARHFGGEQAARKETTGILGEIGPTPMGWAGSCWKSILMPRVPRRRRLSRKAPVARRHGSDRVR